jgi:hypothetical protein
MSILEPIDEKKEKRYEEKRLEGLKAKAQKLKDAEAWTVGDALRKMDAARVFARRTSAVIKYPWHDDTKASEEAFNWAVLVCVCV